MKTRPRKQAIGGFRLVTVGAGLLLLIVASSADALGISVPGSFGRDQLLLVFFGLMLGTIGILGPSFVRVYKISAIVVLNTILLICVIELLSVGALRLFDYASARKSTQAADWRSESYGISKDVPYYDTQEWSAEYWRHYRQAWHNLDYHAYLIWRKAQYSSDTINIDDQGRRITPGNEIGDNPYRVFMFGGSTMWGFGSPDWYTLPAFLVDGLKPLIDRPVSILNFGEGGYVVTQELLALVLELQKGNVPDLVIFYDGINEVWVAGEAGRSGAHYYEDKIARVLESAPHFETEDLERRFLPIRDERLTDSLARSYTALLLRRTGLGSGATRPWNETRFSDQQREKLVDSLLNHYTAVYRLAGALADEYGFECLFFWQPHVGAGNKPLSRAERAMRSGLPYARIFEELYARVELEARSRENLYYFANVLDDRDEQLYIDPFHVTPDGNAIIARSMAEVIATSILDKGPEASAALPGVPD